MPSMRRNAEETKADNVRAMGEPLGLLYSALCQDVWWLHVKWGEYVKLFGKKPSRIDLLNKSAASFFYLVEDVLWESILLHIARLTDKPNTAGKKNLSVHRLPKHISDPVTRGKVDLLLKRADKASTFCRDWRNRRFAHRDLDLALSPAAEALESASREKVNLALAALAAILNEFSHHYNDAEIEFGLDFGGSDAESLLYVLDDGLKAEAERQARWKSGRYDPKDYGPRDL